MRGTLSPCFSHEGLTNRAVVPKDGEAERRAPTLDAGGDHCSLNRVVRDRDRANLLDATVGLPKDFVRSYSGQSADVIDRNVERVD